MSVPEASPDGFTILSAAANVVEIIAGVRTLWSRRAAQTAESILDSADMSPEDLTRAARANEALGDLFAMAVDIGARTRNQQKRQALGRIVGRAFVRQDMARIDETELLLKAIEPIEAAHIQILVKLDEAGRFWEHPNNWRGVSEAQLAKETGQSIEACVSVTATLTSLGILKSRPDEDDDENYRSFDKVAMTTFGGLLLQWLTLEEGEPLRGED